MRRTLILGVVTALLAGAPARAEWREYTYPEFGFAIHFPADPKIEDATYSTGIAAPVKARIYSLDAPDSLYRVTVADFSRTGIGEDAAIEAAVRELSALGEVTIDERARVNQVYGRDLSVAAADGRRIAAALFYYRDRLYRIEGAVLPGSGGDSSINAVRFQQSLRFTNFGAHIPSFEELFGFNRG